MEFQTGVICLEGRFNGVLFALPVWGAYIWRGLFSEFYGMRWTIVFESQKYYFPQPTGRREPWERGFRAPLKNMAGGIILIWRIFLHDLEISYLIYQEDYSLMRVNWDTLDFVSFRLQQIMQHLVHFVGGLDGVRNL